MRFALRENRALFFRVKLILYLFLPIIFNGCLELYTVITINPDGTGMITEKILYSPETVNMITSFAQEDEKRSGTSSLYSEDELKSKESLYGEKVVFAGVKEVKKDSLTGYEAIYKFQDISKVKMILNPDKSLPSEGEGEGSTDEEQVLTFAFKRNKSSVLEIDMGNQQFNSKEKLNEISGGENADTLGENLMRALTPFMSFKMDYRIRINGAIEQSDAKNLQQNEIPVLHIDLAKFLGNFQNIKVLNEKISKSASPEEIFEGIEGIKINFQQKIKVQFH